MFSILVSIMDVYESLSTHKLLSFPTCCSGYNKKNVHSLPQWYALAVVGLALGISYASHYLLFNLPTALTIDDAV